MCCLSSKQEDFESEEPGGAPVTSQPGGAMAGDNWDQGSVPIAMPAPGANERTGLTQGGGYQQSYTHDPMNPTWD